MKNLEKINQVIWELKQKIKHHPKDHELRRDLLKYFHESRTSIEKMAGVPESERSFLLLQERESICCLLIHGAGGSPVEMSLIGEHLFTQGYTVYGIRLPLDSRTADSGIGDYVMKKISKKRDGNGGNGRRRDPSWSVCLAQCEIVLDTLSDYSSSVYLVGFSFGGTLALNLMKKHPVRGTVLISPGIFPAKSSRYIFFRLWKKAVPALAKEIAPVRSTILDLVDNTRAEFDQVSEPLLVLQASDDPVVSSRGFHLLRKISTHPASRFKMFDNGGHVIVQGDRAGEVCDLITDFIRKI